MKTTAVFVTLADLCLDVLGAFLLSIARKLGSPHSASLSSVTKLSRYGREPHR
jgi:hypothetical protein